MTAEQRSGGTRGKRREEAGGEERKREGGRTGSASWPVRSQDQTQLGSGEWKPRPAAGGPAGRGGGQQRRTFARGLWA